MAAAVTLLLAAAVVLLAAVGDAKYIESAAANVNSGKNLPRASINQKHEAFVPLVSFQCGYRNKHMDKHGKWRDDNSSLANCLQSKYDILKYCKRVYSNLEITNIVKYSHMSHINNWCKENDESSCKHQFTVRPYRCIVGEFVSESLQVPSRCRFNHIAGRTKCNDYKFWSLKAESECGLKTEEDTHQSMKLHSFAILEPCGLSMFRGVEYVCCPKSVEEQIEKIVDLEKNIDEDEDDYDDDDEDDFSENNSENKDDKEKLEQDPYFKEDLSNAISEHERFHDAEERLEKKHRKKVTKVITEWSELFERYNKMKTKDLKGAEEYKREMTARFRKTVAALEDENKEQRTQIEELHDERVQSALNEKKRQATHDYRAALAKQVGFSNTKNVFKTLKNYIKAEERDRTHMLNRFRHLLRSDPEAALSFEPIILHRLRFIDLRINGTFAMLHDFPELEKEIRPVAIEFWNNYRHDNTPEINDSLMSSAGSVEEQNEHLIRLYKHTYERTNPGATEIIAHLGASIAVNNDKTEKLSEYRVAANNVATVIGNNKTHKSAPSPSTAHRTPTVTTTTKRPSVDKLIEDSDEDQFDDDDESEQNNIVFTSTKKPITKPEAIVKFLPKFQSSFDKDVPTKILKYSRNENSDKKRTTDLDNDRTESDNDEDEDEDDDDSDESDTSDLSRIEYKTNKGASNHNGKIAIETIVSAPVRVHEEIENSPPAFLRQDMLIPYNNERQHQSFSLVLKDNLFTVVMIACVSIFLVICCIMKGCSWRNAGFIEVDVWTPEEKHVVGMQVNGYENPTYSYFDNAKVPA